MLASVLALASASTALVAGPMPMRSVASTSPAIDMVRAHKQPTALPSREAPLAAYVLRGSPLLLICVHSQRAKVSDKNVWVSFAKTTDIKPGDVISGFQYGQEIAIACTKNGGLYALSNKLPPTGQVRCARSSIDGRTFRPLAAHSILFLCHSRSPRRSATSSRRLLLSR